MITIKAPYFDDKQGKLIRIERVREFKFDVYNKVPRNGLSKNDMEVMKLQLRDTSIFKEIRGAGPTEVANSYFERSSNGSKLDSYIPERGRERKRK